MTALDLGRTIVFGTQQGLYATAESTTDMVRACPVQDCRLMPHCTTTQDTVCSSSRHTPVVCLQMLHMTSTDTHGAQLETSMSLKPDMLLQGALSGPTPLCAMATLPSHLITVSTALTVLI